MKYSFDQIFRENKKDKTLTPKVHIKVGPASFGPGVTFGPGVSFGGVNFFDFKGLDIEAEEEDNVLVIKGFYKR
jgi:hypothetical protein